MELTPIFVVGFIVLGFYKILELFVRRRERMMLIEKLDGEAFNEFIKHGGLPQNYMLPHRSGVRFGVLHLAAGLLGIGLGVVVSYTILSAIMSCGMDQPWFYRNACQGGCVLLFTGLALVISFVIEYRLTHKKND